MCLCSAFPAAEKPTRLVRHSKRSHIIGTASRETARPDLCTPKVKSLRFASTPESSIRFVATRQEMTAAERSALWYDVCEIERLKNEARNASQEFLSREEKLDSSKWPLYKKESGEQCCLSPSVSSRNADSRDWRGLELRINRQRQYRKKLAIRKILQGQQKHRNEHMRLSKVAMRTSKWAKFEAHESGRKDAKIAASIAAEYWMPYMPP